MQVGERIWINLTKKQRKEIMDKYTERMSQYLPALRTTIKITQIYLSRSSLSRAFPWEHTKPAEDHCRGPITSDDSCVTAV